MLLPYQAGAAQDLTSELDRWKSLLDYRGPFRRAWAGRLRRDLEAEAVAASTSMEGVPVTIEQVHHILVISLSATAPPKRANKTRRWSADTAMIIGELTQRVAAERLSGPRAT